MLIKLIFNYKEYLCLISHVKIFILLETEIIQDPRLSLEAIGTYGMLEAGLMKIEDIPENIKSQLIEVGVLEEVIS